MPKYAPKTHIDVPTRRKWIEALITHWGGQRFQFFPDPANDRHVLQFDVWDKEFKKWLTINYGVSLSDKLTKQPLMEQQLRSRYATAWIAIKARLAAIEEGIESPAMAFH